MTSRFPVWILLPLYIATGVTVLQATGPVEGTTQKTIPFDQLGAEAQKQYTGDGIGIIPTAEGARLRAAFQNLEGQATTEGLWITSTKAEAVEPQNGDAAKGEPEPEPVPDRFRVLATAVGRQEPGTLIDQLTSLPRAGKVTSAGEVVTFTRAGLTEEYRVSMDGVRQDFIIAGRPAGQGKLSVELEITGATAETASYGAKLTLTGSGREIAYSRLHVTDATGRELGATLEVISANCLAVRVQDAGAAYPVRIDPTFSDEDWVSMNPGFPGPSSYVYAMVVDGSGNLYIGGEFAFVGGVSANHVAKWNGSTWSALGTGTNDSVSSLALSGSDLYVGGAFTSAGGVADTRGIAKWNGSTWSALGTGTNGSVAELAVSGSDLYIGGWFSLAGGVANTNNIAKWNGSTWSALGTGTNYGIYALAVSGSDLYAGGWFSLAGGVANTNNIAKWNGSTWSALSTGTNGDVSALVVKGSDLYVGGAFTSAGWVSTKYIARWNGSSWSALGSGMNSSVTALAVNGTDLYAGGAFTSAGAADANYIARWNGSSWSALGSGMNHSVFALAADTSGHLFVGGRFTLAGSTASPHLARANLPLMPNVDLLGLVTSSGSLSPAFSSDITEYALTTTSDTLRVTPTVVDAGATVTVNGAPVASGAAATPVPLTEGANTVTIVVTAQDGVTSKTYTIAVTANFPRIEIAAWGNNTGDIPLTDGSTTPVDIGTTGMGYFCERTFTVSNTGTGPLKITSFTLDGPYGRYFSVILPNYTSLPFTIESGRQNIFKVRLSAGHVGGHDAVLHVHTNDPYTPSFDIPVTGNGRVASNGVISIDLPAGSVIDVLERSTDPNFVYIPISRTGGVDGDVELTVSTGGGTATPYSDYMPPPLQKTILNQQSQSGVLITIQPTSPPYPYPSEPNETFNVTISNPTGGATLGAVRTVTVRIIDFEDMAPPTPPVINAPALDALVTLTAGAKYLVSGTAKDDKGVASVQVKLNGSVVGNATLSAPGALSTNWSLLVSPAPDVNTLAVQSTDTQGKTSTEITRTFRAPGPLAVTVNGAHGSVTAGYAPTSIREIGKSYTIKATAKTAPAPGFVFDRWVIGGGHDEGDIGATVDSVRLSTLNFTMRAGLTLTAQFIANPFAAETGAYDGLVRTAAGYTASVATEGHFHLDVQSSGAFSGKLTLDGAAFLVGGAFDNEGVARFGTTRAPSLKFTRTGKRVVEVSLSLGDLDPPGDTADTITGTVTQKHGTTTTGVSDVLMRRAVVPADILAYVPTGSSALYTAVITPQALGSQPAGLTVADYPQGHSLANITVSKTGGITFVGTMADGTTPVSISSTISKGGDSPLFAQLYGKLGFLSGLLHLDLTQNESDMTAAGMLWAKPYSDIQHYPLGWPEVIKTDLRAARYIVPPANSVLHAPDDSITPDSDTRGDLLPAPGATANTQLTFKLPLMTDVLKDVKVSTSDGVTKTTTSDASFSLTITRSTGRITGFFTNPGDNTKPTYQGIIYQKGTGLAPDPGPGAYGWFLTLPLAPRVKTSDGQSGSVELKYQP